MLAMRCQDAQARFLTMTVRVFQFCNNVVLDLTVTMPARLFAAVAQTLQQYTAEDEAPGSILAATVFH